MTSGGKIAVEMTVGGKPKSGASHQPWKSLCDSHIPTARLLLYIFLKPFSRKEPSSPPAPSRFRLILRLEKTHPRLAACGARSWFCARQRHGFVGFAKDFAPDIEIGLLIELIPSFPSREPPHGFSTPAARRHPATGEGSGSG